MYERIEGIRDWMVGASMIFLTFALTFLFASEAIRFLLLRLVLSVTSKILGV